MTKRSFNTISELQKTHYEHLAHLACNITQKYNENSEMLKPDELNNNPYKNADFPIRLDLYKPRLAMDMYVLSQSVKTGIYRVCNELFPRLAQSSRFDPRYFIRHGFESGALDYLSSRLLPGSIHTSNELSPSDDAKIFLSPFGVAPPNWIEDKNVLQAHIIYDLIAIRHPDYFSLEASSEVSNIMASLNQDTVIFAISEFTKKDLLDYRPDLKSDQITVIPLAAGDSFRPCDSDSKKQDVRQRYGIPSNVPYVLSLATLEIRKNLDGVVRSFVLYLDENKNSDLHLVLSGMSGWKLEQFNLALAEAANFRDRIILTGFVEDDDLSAIYSDAACFIYLSRYEGFGLPPLEAMSCGTPVICSNNSSLPEVVGDAGLMFDADDIVGVARGIKQIVSSNQYREELSILGLERAKLFNWDWCAKRVEDVLFRSHCLHLDKKIKSRNVLANSRSHASYIGYDDGSKGPVFSSLKKGRSNISTWPIWIDKLPVAEGVSRVEGGKRLLGNFKIDSVDYPLITYVTVVRNNAMTLERTIKSVQQQKYHNVEHIIVDGKSTDGTLDIILKYSDKLDYFVSEPDGGLYDALNKAIPLARGRFICVLNSDDWLEPNATDIVVKYAGNLESNSLLLTAAKVCDGEITHHWMPAFVNPGSYFLCANDCHNAIYASKIAYEKSGPYDGSYKIAADFKWIMTCLDAGAIFTYTKEATVNYSLGGTSGDFLQHSLECMRVVQERFPFLTQYEVSGLYHAFFVFSSEDNSYESNRPANITSFLREIFAKYSDNSNFLNALGWASIVNLDHPADRNHSDTMLDNNSGVSKTTAPRIAFVDHSFHSKTLSTDFLPEILRRHGCIVDYFWDGAWNNEASVQWQAVQDYDVVIMFQAFCPIEGQYYRHIHSNVVFIPMLDQFGIWQGPLFNLTSYWEPFQGSKILSFSNAIHCMLMGFGIKSFFARYYPQIPADDVVPGNGLHGFFWLRREEQIPWSTIKKLIGDTKFDSLHIHLAHDPGTPEPIMPTEEDIERHNITFSTWFENKADFNNIVNRANIFFAARMEEGIGQSFLEAMARGQCVVAPNEGTMNEYIIPGVNGLLYNPKEPQHIDFSHVNKIGLQAKEGAAYGRALWEISEKDIVEFILSPSETQYLGKYQHNF
jgi:glycosyltransferase involved in cell wall biosynthesis